MTHSCMFVGRIAGYDGQQGTVHHTETYSEPRDLQTHILCNTNEFSPAALKQNRKFSEMVNKVDFSCVKQKLLAWGK